MDYNQKLEVFWKLQPLSFRLFQGLFVRIFQYRAEIHLILLFIAIFSRDLVQIKKEFLRRQGKVRQINIHFNTFRDEPYQIEGGISNIWGYTFW